MTGNGRSVHFFGDRKKCDELSELVSEIGVLGTLARCGFKYTHHEQMKEGSEFIYEATI